MTFHSLLDPFTRVNEAEARSIQRQVHALEAFRRACNRAIYMQGFLADLGLVLPNTSDAHKQAESRGFIVTEPTVIGGKGAEYRLKSGREALKNGRYFLLERVNQPSRKPIPTINVTVFPNNHCRVATYIDDEATTSLFEKNDVHLTGLVGVVAGLLGQDDDIGMAVFHHYTRRVHGKPLPESLQKYSRLRPRLCHPCASGAAPAPTGK
jgi:hypothetical protein